jgi:uncharacterized protein (TIGR02611 family)
MLSKLANGENLIWTRVISSHRYADKNARTGQAVSQNPLWVHLLIGGIAMVVTPGPGWFTILLALGVLAAEFVWARRLLDHLKEQGARLGEMVLLRQPAGRA